MPTDTYLANLDTMLAAMSITERNLWLDQLAYDEAEAKAEQYAENAWLRAAEQGNYAGTEEEARDRWFESMAY